MVQAKKTKLHPIQWGVLAIPAAGAVWFAQPLLIGVVGVGTILGWGGCLIAAALIVFVPGMVRKGGGNKGAAWMVTGVFLAGVLWCGYLTTLIFSASANSPPDSATVVVLGCLGGLSSVLRMVMRTGVDWLARGAEMLYHLLLTAPMDVMEVPLWSPAWLGWTWGVGLLWTLGAAAAGLALFARRDIR